MKAIYRLSTLLLVFLNSCGIKSYAKESVAPITPLQAVPASRVQSGNFAEQRALKRLKNPLSDGNWAYSPLSTGLTDLIEEQKLDEYESYVKNLLNISNSSSFSISAKAVVASTSEIEERRREELIKSGVDVYVGSVSELEASLSDHFGQNVKLSENGGSFILANLEAEDRFNVPLSVETKAFNGTGSHSFTTRIASGQYARMDNATLCEVKIGATSMRFLLPNEGVGYLEVNPALLLKTAEWEKARIMISCPEFSIRNQDYEMESGRFIAQECQFEYNRFGIKGRAFTISGPTATDPGYDIAIDMNRPFYFASMYLNLPAFLGRVVSL